MYADIIIPEFEFRKNLLSDLKDTEFVIKDPKNTNSNIEKNSVANNPFETDDIEDGENQQFEKPAILTAKSPTDPFYNQLSVYPLYNQSINEECSTLFQMLKVYDQALNAKTKDLDAKCYPWLLVDGQCGMDDEKRKLNEKKTPN